MSEAKTQATSSGIGLTGAVFLVFLTLKLLEKIDWSWWWVTAPLWMPALLVLSIVGVLCTVIAIGVLVASIRRRAARKAKS